MAVPSTIRGRGLLFRNVALDFHDSSPELPAWPAVKFRKNLIEGHIAGFLHSTTCAGKNLATAHFDNQMYRCRWAAVAPSGRVADYDVHGGPFLRAKIQMDQP